VAIKQPTSSKPPQKVGILKALLASPLVGSELDLARPREEGRKVDIGSPSAARKGGEISER
jgi:hypothetical protein